MSSEFLRTILRRNSRIAADERQTADILVS